MRERKFKVWDKKNKKWVKPEQLQNPNVMSIDLTAEGFKFKNAGFIFYKFTGIKDKNGKEICEGDIILIRTGCFIWKNKGKCEVKFLDGRFMAGNENLSNWTDVEILGNMVDNPELAKEFEGE